MLARAALRITSSAAGRRALASTAGHDTATTVNAARLLVAISTTEEP